MTVSLNIALSNKWGALEWHTLLLSGSAFLRWKPLNHLLNTPQFDILLLESDMGHF